MADKRKLFFIAGFVAVFWAACAAIVAALAHFLKSATDIAMVFIAVIYSCLFGVLGWVAYKSKGRRDGWPAANKRNPALPRVRRAGKTNSGNAADSVSGWKRS